MSAGDVFQTVFVLACLLLIAVSMAIRAGRAIDRVKRRLDREFPVPDEHPLYMSGVERRRRGG